MFRHLVAATAVAVPVGILSSCSPKPATPPVSVETAPRENEAVDLSSKATALVDHLVKGEYGPVTAEFDSAMSAQMTEAGLAQTMGTLQQQVGSFQRRSGVQRTQEQGYEVVLVTCEFERANLNVRVVYDQDGLVTGLFIVPA